jgi:hypothetical protein
MNYNLGMEILHPKKSIQISNLRSPSPNRREDITQGTDKWRAERKSSSATSIKEI